MVLLQQNGKTIIGHNPVLLSPLLVHSIGKVRHISILLTDLKERLVKSRKFCLVTCTVCQRGPGDLHGGSLTLSWKYGLE